MKLCEFENCQKQAYYANSFMNPTRCKEHKLSGQKTQKAICICGKATPIFGLKNEKKASCCSKCKTDEMIDIYNKKCKCGLAQPCFGLENDKKASCCIECKTADMIDLKHIKCKCGKSRPNFGLENDKKASCCNECKTDNMFDLNHKKCKCGKARPSFGLENDKNPTCCKECRTDIMINIVSKKCKCGLATPSFGLETDKIRICCSKCKTNEMINIKDKRCVCGNSTSPCFGLTTDKNATCCSKCKTNVMIDIVNKKCICGSYPSYGLETDKIRICCKECKTNDMINIVSRKCICEKTQPTFGMENDKIPTCCKECRTDEMIDISTKKCKSNYLDADKKFTCETYGNKKYKGYCTRCYAYHFPTDPLTFQINCKTKEQAVCNFINKIFTGFNHDKALWISACECIHRRRIDHRKLIGNTLLCIETDENQHKYYKEKDERIRYDDLMMIHGGKFIFIRFNPDKYKENGVSKNPTIASRLRVLEEEINKQIKRIENEENTDLLEIIPMYFDTK